MKKLRIFVGSPGDVQDERQIVALVVEELRRIVNVVQDVELEAVRWETHAWPDVGEDAQDVINRELGEFDVFIGVMWRRFGTPTGRAASGTGEEFERAYASFQTTGRPKIMFYFRVTPFYTTDQRELTQFAKVVKFRKKLEGAGVLFWQYDQPLEFERFVREHLIRQVLELASVSHSTASHKAKQPEAPAERQGPLVFLSAARSDTDKVLPVYRALSEAGLRPWLDVQDLIPGERWEAAIDLAIRRAAVFVPFISNKSMFHSPYFKKELARAMSIAATAPRLAIVPVRLAPIVPPASLAQYQWIDLASDADVERLVTSISQMILARPPAPSAKRRRKGTSRA